MELVVVPWPLPAPAHDAHSEYVERFWLPVLGPTSFVTIRHFAHRFGADPDGFVVDVAAVSGHIGVGRRDGPHAPLRRTLARLERFGLVVARPGDGDTIAVRCQLPWLSPRLERKLPDDLRNEHARRRAYARAG